MKHAFRRSSKQWPHVGFVVAEWLDTALITLGWLKLGNIPAIIINGTWLVSFSFLTWRARQGGKIKF